MFRKPYQNSVLRSPKPFSYSVHVRLKFTWGEASLFQRSITIHPPPSVSMSHLACITGNCLGVSRNGWLSWSHTLEISYSPVLAEWTFDNVAVVITYAKTITSPWNMADIIWSYQLHRMHFSPLPVMGWLRDEDNWLSHAGLTSLIHRPFPLLITCSMQHWSEKAWNF